MKAKLNLLTVAIIFAITSPAFADDILSPYTGITSDDFNPYAGTTSDDFNKGGRFDLSTDAGLKNYNKFYPMRTLEQMNFNYELAQKIKYDPRVDDEITKDIKLAFSDIILNFTNISSPSRSIGSNAYDIKSSFSDIAGDINDLINLNSKLKSKEISPNVYESEARKKIANINHNSAILNKTLTDTKYKADLLLFNGVITAISMPSDLVVSSVKLSLITGTTNNTIEKNLVNTVDVASSIKDIRKIYKDVKIIFDSTNYVNKFTNFDGLVNKQSFYLILNSKDNIKIIEKSLAQGGYRMDNYLKQAKLRAELLDQQSKIIQALKTKKERDVALGLLSKLSKEKDFEVSTNIAIELYKQFSSNPGFSSIYENALKVADIELPSKQNSLDGTCAGKNPPAVCSYSLNNMMSVNNQIYNSHIGSGQMYLSPKTTNQVQVQSYAAVSDNKIKSGTEQVALAQNTQAFDVLQDWTVTEGDQAKHFSIGDSFGSITAPDPNKPTIAALNNADVQQTTMTKVYKVPVGTKQVNVGMLANFVTNEYPEFVGSEFNDKATIEIKTGSGNIYQATLFNKELNSANFTAVSGLPSPMSGSGGQTGFEQLNKTINVANGGNLTITVKTANVGDMAVPSATLINATSVK